MNMAEDLIAWAEKWNIDHTITENDDCIQIQFDSDTWGDPIFSYHKPTGSYVWHGGD